MVRLRSGLSLLFSGLAHAEHYLQSPLQLEHACDLILDSELFAFHSERMCEILADEAAVVSVATQFSTCLGELTPQLLEHRSTCSVHPLQRSSSPWTTQPKFPTILQTLATSVSTPHGSRPR